MAAERQAPAAPQTGPGGYTGANMERGSPAPFCVIVFVTERMLRGGYLLLQRSFASDAGLVRSPGPASLPISVPLAIRAVQASTSAIDELAAALRCTATNRQASNSADGGGARPGPGMEPSAQPPNMEPSAPTGMICKLHGLGGWLTERGVREGTAVRLQFQPPRGYTLDLPDLSSAPELAAAVRVALDMKTTSGTQAARAGHRGALSALAPASMAPAAAAPPAPVPPPGAPLHRVGARQAPFPGPAGSSPTSGRGSPSHKALPEAGPAPAAASFPGFSEATGPTQATAAAAASAPNLHPASRGQPSSSASDATRAHDPSRPLARQHLGETAPVAAAAAAAAPSAGQGPSAASIQAAARIAPQLPAAQAQQRAPMPAALPSSHTTAVLTGSGTEPAAPGTEFVFPLTKDALDRRRIEFWLHGARRLLGQSMVERMQANEEHFLRVWDGSDRLPCARVVMYKRPKGHVWRILGLGPWMGAHGARAGDRLILRRRPSDEGGEGGECGGFSIRLQHAAGEGCDGLQEAGTIAAGGLLGQHSSPPAPETRQGTDLAAQRKAASPAAATQEDSDCILIGDGDADGSDDGGEHLGTAEAALRSCVERDSVMPGGEPAVGPAGPDGAPGAHGRTDLEESTGRAGHAQPGQLSPSSEHSQHLDQAEAQPLGPAHGNGRRRREHQHAEQDAQEPSGGERCKQQRDAADPPPGDAEAPLEQRQACAGPGQVGHAHPSPLAAASPPGQGAGCSTATRSPGCTGGLKRPVHHESGGDGGQHDDVLGGCPAGKARRLDHASDQAGPGRGTDPAASAPAAAAPPPTEHCLPRAAAAGPAGGLVEGAVVEYDARFGKALSPCEAAKGRFRVPAAMLGAGGVFAHLPRDRATAALIVEEGSERRWQTSIVPSKGYLRVNCLPGLGAFAGDVLLFSYLGRRGDERTAAEVHAFQMRILCCGRAAAPPVAHGSAAPLLAGHQAAAAPPAEMQAGS